MSDTSGADKPQRLGPYVLRQRVGKGGFAEVWRARRDGAGADCALKILHDASAASEDVQLRLEAEACALRKLDHPNIVRIQDSMKVEGQFVIEMEFLDGTDIASHALETKLSEAQCVGLILDAARALAAAHEKEILHRDIKPDNIGVTRDGVVKLLDFGLAMMRPQTVGPQNTNEWQTAPGERLGTHAYMAPECFASGARAATPASDVYALALTLLELLAGRNPWERRDADGGTASGVHARIESELSQGGAFWRARDHVPDISPDLGKIIEQALERHPANRFQTALALARQLENFLAGRSVGVRSRSRFAYPLFWRERNPVAARVIGWGLFGSTLMLIAVATYITINSIRSAASERGLREQADLAREDAEIHQHASEALNTLNRSPREALRLAIDATERSVHRFGAPPPEVQFSLAHAIDAAREERSWRSVRSTCSAMSADGMWHAAGDPRGRVRIIDLARGRESEIKAHDSEVSAIAFNPDGTQLITAGKDMNLRRWTLAGEPVEPALARRATVVTAIAFAPDGKELVVAEGNRTIVRCDLNGNRIGNPLVGHEAVIRSVLITETSIVSADIGAVQSTLRFSSRNGEPLHEPVRLEGWTYTVALSADGKTIASGGSDKAIRFWDLRGEPFGAPLYGHSADVRSLSFRSDGVHLASASEDGIMWIWNLMGRRPVKVINAHSGEVTFAGFRAQKPTIFTEGADGSCREWMLQPFEAQTSIDHSNAVRFASEGRLITTSRDGSIRARDRSGKTVGTTSTVQAGAQIAFSKDARWYWSFSTYGQTMTLAEIGGPAKTLKFNHTVKGVTASSEHQRLIISDGERLAVYDWDGNMIASWPAEHHPSLEVNDPRSLVAGIDFAKKASLWNFSGTCVAKPAHGRSCRAMTFSPDGAYWALGCEDGSVAVIRLPEQFDSTPNAPAADLSDAAYAMPGHKAPVTALAFSVDGQRIASAAADGTIRISDSSGHELTPLWSIGCAVSSLAFSPDGRVLASAGEDDIARFWIADWKGWLELGRKRLATAVKEPLPAPASR